MLDQLEIDTLNTSLNKIVPNAGNLTAEQLEQIKGLLSEAEHKDDLTKLREQTDAFQSRTYETFEKEHREKLAKGGFITGYKELDKNLFFAKTDLNIIQAMSNHGKTNFMLNLMYRFLTEKENADKKALCIFITYETSTLRIEEKFLNIISSYKYDKTMIKFERDLKTDMFNNEQREGYYTYPKKEEYKQAIETYNELIKDSRLVLLNNIPLEQLETLISVYKRKFPERTIILFLDYIQIIRNEIRAEGWQRIKELAYNLERLATGQEIIIFTGSQVNDKRETREGKDVYNSATNVIDIFNHSHDKLLNHDDLKSKYKDKVSGKGIITLTIDKAKFFSSNYFADYLLFNGFKFEENSGQVISANYISTNSKADRKQAIEMAKTYKD